MSTNMSKGRLTRWMIFAKRRSILYHYDHFLLWISRSERSSKNFQQFSFFKLIQSSRESFKRNKGKTKKKKIYLLIRQFLTISHASFFSSNFNKSTLRKRICTTGQAFFFLFGSKNLLAAFFFLLFRLWYKKRREHRHLALVFFSGQRNRKTTVSNRCR